MSSDVRVRFAPSPTGTIHIGNVRTAIFNHLFARRHGGKFLLRVEDTDRERSTAEAERQVLDVLDWLGLDWDAEGEGEGFMRQSARMDRYQAVVEQWLANGVAYRSDRATGRHAGDKKGAQPSARGEALWLRTTPEDLAYDDLILGVQTQPAKQVQDFVIVRSSGAPMFLLANTIDDSDMGITHVLRGADHSTNTFRQMLLYRALGVAPPRFGHLPLIVDASGKKYKKRPADADSIAFVHEFRERGYLPEALFNYLSLLGWSPKPVEGGDGETVFREKLSREELIAAFGLDRVRAAPAQFDIVKLGALNYRYLLDRLDRDPQTLIDALKADVQAEGLDSGRFDDEQYQVLIREAGTRSRTLKDLIRRCRFFFVDRVEVDPGPKAVRKAFRKDDVWERVAAATRALQAVAANAWDRARILDALTAVAEECADGKMGDIAQPVRVLVTGTAASPAIDVTLELLGRARTLERLADEENRKRLQGEA